VRSRSCSSKRLPYFSAASSSIVVTVTTCGCEKPKEEAARPKSMRWRAGRDVTSFESRSKQRNPIANPI
jgi:hypothetical protein